MSGGKVLTEEELGLAGGIGVEVVLWCWDVGVCVCERFKI